MSKQKNGYFYSKNQDLLNRIAEELRYSGRRYRLIPGGIVQFALPPVKRPVKVDPEEKEKRDRKVQASKRERWISDGR